MKAFFVLACLSLAAFATENDRLHMPKPFNVQGGKAVFTDMEHAHYSINYDLTAKNAKATAYITLTTLEEGFPIFDSVVAPTAITLDGEKVTALETKTPSGETTVRVLSKKVAAGEHALKIELPVTNLVRFTEAGVSSAFWTSDLSERNFLEAYLPANLEYDQVKMMFDIKFIGSNPKQVIYTNGDVKKTSESTYLITYPDYFNASSIFFHTTPVDSMKEVRFSFKSIDGRDLPGVVYIAKNSLSAGSLESYKEKTIEIMRELEGDYGPFPHQNITVYMAGMGGMEYCGATMTELRALGHELFHSYFARGVQPANGNSGWLDEALASWRDGGYQTSRSMSGTSSMSAHPYYTRITDRQAYTYGKSFMEYLDGKMKDKGGLKPFMRHMVDKRTFAPLFVEEFMQEMSDFYGVSVIEDFKKYTFGQNTGLFAPNKAKENPIHRKMSLKELANYL